MRTGWLVALVALSLTAAAVAQQEQPPGGRPGRPGRGQGGPGGFGGGMGSPLDMAQRLGETLGLSEEQQAKFDAVVEKYKPKFEELGIAAKTQEIMNEMREARQANDEAKFAEARQKLDELRESTRPLMNEFYAQVTPILTPAQAAQLQDYRDRMDRGRGGPDGLMRRLPEELSLTAEQKTKYDKIVADFRAQMQAVAPVERELQTARRDNDAARVAELEKEIEAKLGPDQGVPKFLDQVETLLTEEQKAKLPELWARLTGGGADDVRGVLQAARRLTLDAQQQKKLSEITREAARASRGAQTAEKRAEVTKTIKGKVVAILNAQQAEEFEQALQRGPRAGRGGPGAPGEGRPQRPGRGGGQGGQGEPPPQP